MLDYSHVRLPCLDLALARQRFERPAPAANLPRRRAILRLRPAYPIRHAPLRVLPKGSRSQAASEMESIKVPKVLVPKLNRLAPTFGLHKETEMGDPIIIIIPGC